MFELNDPTFWFLVLLFLLAKVAKAWRDLWR